MDNCKPALSGGEDQGTIYADTVGFMVFHNIQLMPVHARGADRDESCWSSCSVRGDVST